MFDAHYLSYKDTNAFSKIVTAYLDGATDLQPFYDKPPTLDGIKAKMEERRSFQTDRSKLVTVLKEQYQAVATTEAVQKNIELLSLANTFTICTAHQPNLFTGPLYFIYKILHAIKLADTLAKAFPQDHFVPVYYMGSEDADFAELNHTYVDGKKLEWKKEQKGAVGRMIVDKTLTALIDELEGQLLVEAHGAEIIGLLKDAYTIGKTIQAATFELLHKLYGDFGLIVLIPDHPELKRQLQTTISDDIFQNTSSQIVQKTSEALAAHYHSQAHPREINLFYLKDAIRERIEEREGRYVILNTEIVFTREELENELAAHPERFSPNVILRGIYQETILPNLAFIGGGGELAYWLQLKELFKHYNVPYPILVLRNSFLVIEEKWKKKIEQLGLDMKQLFQSQNDIMRDLAVRLAQNPVLLNGNRQRAEDLFLQIKDQAEKVDASLSRHVASIQTRYTKALEELEKKMLRAEKRKHADEAGQLERLKTVLFPKNGLQERVENFSLFYAKWGKEFIQELYKNSLALEQEFTILTASAGK